MAAHMEDAAVEQEIKALDGVLAQLRISETSPLPWWLAELEKVVSSEAWTCRCTGICQRGILTGHAMCNHARRDPDAVKPENVLQSFDSLGLHCLASSLASIIVEHIINLSAPEPNHANPNNAQNDQNNNNMENDIRDRVPSRYSFDRWRALEAYLRDHVDEEKGSSVGLELLVRLLDADSDWLLYQTLSSLWRASYGDRDVTSVGLRLAHCGVQRPLIRLLEHRNLTIVLSAVGVVVSVLHGLEEQYQMSFINAGICEPLRQLIVGPRIPNISLKEREAVVTKAINLLGWLACGGRVCQEALVAAGMVEALVPLISSHHSEDEVARTAWMAVNWLIYVDSGKQRFLKAGGLPLLLRSLNRTPLTTGVVFASRKLAMHPPTQKALIEANAVPLLVKRASELSSHEDRMRYVITLALSFIILDPADTPTKELIAASGAEECIAASVAQIAIEQNLNVLYTSLQDQRTLIYNASSTAQLFGLWWTLHLLVSEAAGHYKRKDYARMLMDEGLLPRILALLHSEDIRIAKYAALIIESLAKAPHVRLRVIEGGALDHLLRLAHTLTPKFDFDSKSKASTQSNIQNHSLQTGLSQEPKVELQSNNRLDNVEWQRLWKATSHACALLITCAPELDSAHLVSREKGREKGEGEKAAKTESAPSLRAQCEHYAVRAVDEESVAILIDLAYALHLYRLQARCLAFLVLHPDPSVVPLFPNAPFASDSPSTKLILSDLDFIKKCNVAEVTKAETSPMQ